MGNAELIERELMTVGQMAGWPGPAIIHPYVKFTIIGSLAGAGIAIGGVESYYVPDMMLDT